MPKLTQDTEILVSSRQVNSNNRRPKPVETPVEDTPIVRTTQLPQILDEKFVRFKTICSMAGLTTNQAATLKSKGVIAPASNDRYPLYASMRSIVSFYRDTSDNPKEQLQIEKVAGERARTRKINLAIAQAEGGLVDAEKASTIFTESLRSVALGLNQLPDTLERIGVIEPRHVERVRDEVDKVRAQIHNKIKRDKFDLTKARKKVLSTDKQENDDDSADTDD